MGTKRSYRCCLRTTKPTLIYKATMVRRRSQLLHAMVIIQRLASCCWIRDAPTSTPGTTLDALHYGMLRDMGILMSRNSYVRQCRKQQHITLWEQSICGGRCDTRCDINTLRCLHPARPSERYVLPYCTICAGGYFFVCSECWKGNFT